MVTIFDVEAATKNKGNPFTASNKMVSYSVYRVGQQYQGEPTFVYYTDISFLTPLRSAFEEAKLLIGFNVKYDLHWAARYGLKPPDKVRIWDCQIAEFIISGQVNPYPSLDECLAKYGLGQKDDKIKAYWDLGVDTTDIPVDELKFYNNLDVELTYKLYLKQQEEMTDKQKKLCLLMGLDLLVLAEMEQNGVLLDRKLCEEKAEKARKELDEVTANILRSSPTPGINLDSGQHLSCLLYGGAFDITVVASEEPRVFKSGAKKGQEYLKRTYRTDVFKCEPLFTPLKGTETKLKKKLPDGTEITIYETNEDVLKRLKKPTKAHKELISLLLKRAELAKLLDTYYEALPALVDKMEWGEYIHGQYNQVVARTGRLSSSKPNMQNFSSDVDELLVSRFND